MSGIRFILTMALTVIALLTPALTSAHQSVAPSATAGIDRKALLHDTRNLAYRSPFGAVPAGTSVRLRLRTAHNGADSVTLQLETFDQNLHATPAGSQKMKRVSQSGKYDLWEGILKTGAVTIYGYDFLVRRGSAHIYYSDAGAALGGVGDSFPKPPDQAFRVTSYAPTFKAPSWAPGMVLYQIFPDSFYNGDTSNDSALLKPVYAGIVPYFDPNESSVPQGQFQFYGGDLQGIVDKLPYLKDLGVNTLYLNPIFLAPTNHKYDTSDYYQIDPHFGTMATLQTLLHTAHSMGMHVILDAVFNHVSTDSIYVNQFGHFSTLGAYQSKSSPYYPFFTFLDWPAGLVTFPGTDSLAVLQENDAVKDYIFRQPDSVAQHWLATGTDGWRLDAAQQRSHEWWTEFRASVKAKYPDDIVICECDFAPIDAVSYLLGTQFDGAMNYRFRDIMLQFFANGGGTGSGPATAKSFWNQLMGMIEEYPLPALYSSMNLVDSHDTSRILSALAGNTAQLKQVITFQATWLGAPHVLYGDEAGMTDANSPDPAYASRAFFPWQHIDASLHDYYRKVLTLRDANPALQDGSIAPLILNNAHRMVAFMRHDARQTVAVVINDEALAHTVTLTLKGLKNGTKLVDGLSGKSYTVTRGMVRVKVAPLGSAVLAGSTAN